MTHSSRFVRVVSLLSFVLSSCHAAGTRGAKTMKQSRHSVICQEELSLEIICKEANSVCQDFSTKPGSCESKMFQVHGGPCRAGASQPVAPMARQPFVDTTLSSDTAANCLDVNGGLPSVNGLKVFVVISDVEDPTKKSSMWTTIGGYAKTDFTDYEVGEGLGDSQNITLYSSEDTSYQTMLQTMIFYAPCEGTPLETLDRGQSVQLIATAVDPNIEANFDVRVTSLTDQTWNVKRITMATSGNPPFEVLPLPAATRTVSGTRLVTRPYTVAFDRSEQLTILSTVLAVNPKTGDECRVSGLFDAPPAQASSPSSLLGSSSASAKWTPSTTTP